MGAVLEAIQEPIERRVALKVLHRKYALEPQITARFFNEARAVNLIDHPGIVQVSDYGQIEDGTAYLVMEFLKGETLNRRIKRMPLGIADILRIARQLAAALAAAHEKNVLHRDLKPDNIMLVPDPESDIPGRERIKLLDFGIAKVLPNADGDESPKTATDVVMGTPRYMAPEQCRGGGSVIDGKADVYSLGVLLYELLAGQPPFSGAAGEVLAMHIYEQPRPLRELAPQVSEDICNLVHRLLAKKKEDRPSMAEVQTVLEQLSVRNSTGALPTLPGAMSSGLYAAADASDSKAAKSDGAAQASTLGLSSGQQNPMPRGNRRTRLLIPAATFVVTFVLGIGLWKSLHTPVPRPVLSAKDASSAGEEKVVSMAVPLVHFVIRTRPSGAQVLGSDDKLLGTTPWIHEQPKSPGRLDIKLRLKDHAEKLVQLDSNADANLDEKLEPEKKPGRSSTGGSGRSGGTGRKGANSTGKNGIKTGVEKLVD